MVDVCYKPNGHKYVNKYYHISVKHTLIAHVLES